MPALTPAELLTLQSQVPHTARVAWYLAVAPYGDPCFTALINQPGWVDERDQMTITYDGDLGEANIQAGMTLWIGSDAEAYDIGKVRVRSIDTVAKTISVAENSEIVWNDNLHLTCPGAYGFRQIWSVLPRLTDDGDVYMDYDIGYTDEGDHMPPKANAGPPAVAWIDPVTGLATVPFTSDRSFTSEIGATLTDYVWQFNGAVAAVGPPAANMVLWLDASQETIYGDGDPVHAWTDQSGSGNHATQPVGADQPIFRTNQVAGQPAIEFVNSGTDHMELPNGFADFTGGLTVFAVINTTAFQNNGPAIVELGNSAVADVIKLIADGASDIKFYVSPGDTLNGDADIGEWEMWDALVEAGAAGAVVDGDLYRDSILEDSSVIMRVPTNINRTSNMVGRTNWTWNETYWGYIAEIIIYDAELTAAQRWQVRHYLVLKYGLDYVGEGTCADPIEIAWDTPGFYYVSLTVTDDNGETGIVWVPVWIFEDGVEEPFTQVEVVSQQGDVGGGWSCQLNVFQTNTAAEEIIYDFPDGALVVLFTRTWYDGSTEEEVGGFCHRENIRFVGWLEGETLSFNAEDGTVAFSAVSHDGWMRRLKMFAFTLEDIDNPDDWHEMVDLCIDRAMLHTFEFRSTVNQVCHVEPVGEWLTRHLKVQSFPDSNLYEQVDDKLLAAAMCRLLTDRQGILRATRNPQFLDAGDRAGVAEVCVLTVPDWYGVVDEEHLHREELGEIKLGGVAYDDPYIARAPGVATSQAAENFRSEGYAPVDQDELSRWAGQMWTAGASRLRMVPVELKGNWPVFDPAFQEYVRLTTTDPLVRNPLTNARFIVREVEFSDESGEGTSLTILGLEPENEIMAGCAVIVPDDPSPDYPDYPIPDYPAPTWGGDLTHFIIVTSQGVFVTESFDEENPIWYACNGGLGTAQRQAIFDLAFDYSSGARAFLTVNDVTVGGAFSCASVWDRATWAQRFTSLQARTMIPGADPCAVGDINWNTYDGLWRSIWCDPTNGAVLLIGGAHDVPNPAGCNGHKIAWQSGDALASLVAGDGLWHDPFADCGPDHCSTPFPGNITSGGGRSLWTYGCGWAAGGDSHRGLSTNNGNVVDTSAGQVIGWTADPLWHARAGAEVMYFGNTNLDIYKSSDYGSTWAAVGGGGTLPVIVGDFKHGLAMHNLDTSMLMYASATGVLRRSSDGGSTWGVPTTQVAAAQVVTPAMVSGYAEGEAFVVGCDQPVPGGWIFLTTDFGESWYNKSGNLDSWLGALDGIYMLIAVQEGAIS